MIVSGPSIQHLDIPAPPSKSVWHRELIVRFLCGGRDHLEPSADDNDDVIATRACLKALAGAKPGEDVVLPCNESGSTLRFMIPVAAAFLSGMNCRIVVQTKGRLFDRPIRELAEAMAPHGVSIIPDDETRSFVVTGSMTPGDYSIDGSVSSQYISGLLMALPVLGSGSIRVTGTMKSVHYVELTEAVMRKYGCTVSFEDNIYRVITGGYDLGNDPGCNVEGDWSNGAFLMCLKLASGAEDLTVEGLDPDSVQGDRAITGFLDLISQGKTEITFDCNDIPDIAPYMAVVSAFCFDRAELTGIGRLRIKESDRVAAVREQLAAFGIETEEGEDSLVIRRYTGSIPLDVQSPVSLSSHHDHRMAMCAVLLAVFLKTDVDIDDVKCLDKSFPKLRHILTKEITL